MEHEPNRQSDINALIIETLEQRRRSIKSELARLAVQATELERSSELLDRQIEVKNIQPDTVLPVRVTAGSSRWTDGGYIGGYESIGADVDLQFECNDLSLAYLYALANSPQPLAASSGTVLSNLLNKEERIKGLHRYTDVSLHGVKVNDEWIEPPSPILDAWQSAKAVGRHRISEMLDSVIENNPYKDIPVRDLHDVLLRKEILNICEPSAVRPYEATEDPS